MSAGKERARKWTPNSVKRRRSKKQEELSPKEKARLAQLLICMVLFGVMLVGRGLPSGHLLSLSESVGELVHRNTDFRSAFAKVGESVSDGEPFVQTFGVLWSEVFGAGSTEGEGTGEESGTQPEEPLPGESVAPVEDAVVEGGETPAEPPVEEMPATETNGLLEDETATPVMGVLTSVFGYRNHPIDGEWKHHDGVDIMADEGTPILAFASGEVEYIGESPAYGLYLRIQHEDGVSSFYAHCNELLVKPGQKVQTGDTIALVGATGNVTGAHLHLELRKDGELIDPSPYIEYQQTQQTQ